MIKTAAELRAQVLAQPMPPPAVVDIDGIIFHIRAASLRDRENIQKLAGLKVTQPKQRKRANGAKVVSEPEVEMRIDSLMAAACCTLTVDGVGNPVFDANTDLDVIRSAATGSTLARLAARCVMVLNGRDPNAEDLDEEEPADEGEK